MTDSRADTKQIPTGTLKHVLIIKMGAAGDVLMATPMLAALHAAHPGIYITWVVEDTHAALLEGNPLIGRLVPMRSSRWKRSLRRLRGIAWLRETRRLRQAIYHGEAGPVDAAICCHAEEARWSALLWGAPVRIGLFAYVPIGWKMRLYTQSIGRPHQIPPTHYGVHYLLATRALGCPDAGEHLLLPETPGERPFLDRFAAEHQLTPTHPRIVLAPFTTWPTKGWEPDRWAALIDWLAERYGAQILLTMTAADRDEAQRLQDMTSPSARQSLTLAEGTTLRQYVALIRSADLVISPDSSALHIAAATDIPSLTLFGPTDPAEIMPRVHPKGRLLVHPLPCAPCRQSRHCTNPVFRQCMGALSLSAVQEAVTELLSDFRK